MRVISRKQVKCIVIQWMNEWRITNYLVGESFFWNWIIVRSSHLKLSAPVCSPLHFAEVKKNFITLCITSWEGQNACWSRSLHGCAWTVKCGLLIKGVWESVRWMAPINIPWDLQGGNACSLLIADHRGGKQSRLITAIPCVCERGRERDHRLYLLPTYPTAVPILVPDQPAC